MSLVSDSIALLREMVSTPSVSFEEDAVCELISSTLNEWGIEHVMARNNILAFNKNFDPSKKTLVLDAHIDTVPATDSYTRNPFDPGDNQMIVYGLGSNDDGGCVVSMIATFRHFYDAALPINLVLALCCEEERSGSNGAKWIYGEDGPVKADWVIVGEPTGMRIATSERGLLVLDAEAQGVSGHAARDEGVNALYIALEDIQALRSHKFKKKSKRMGDVRLNVTQIEAGTTHNVVPDLCKFVVDVRPTEVYDNVELLDELQSICKSKLKARNLANKSSATYSGSPLLKTAKKLDIETFSSPTTSDWMRTYCDAIKMGPGDSARSHKADEFIMTSEIADAIEKYIKYIETFYGDTLE